MAIAFFIALFSIFSFSELSLMFPRAGTLGSYTEVAMGHFPAMASVLGGYVAVAFFGLTAELLLIGFVTNSLFPWANPTIVAALMLGRCDAGQHHGHRHLRQIAERAGLFDGGCDGHGWPRRPLWGWATTCPRVFNPLPISPA